MIKRFIFISIILIFLGIAASLRLNNVYATTGGFPDKSGPIPDNCTGACAEAQASAAQQGRSFIVAPGCNQNVCTLLACTNGIVLDTYTYYPTPNCPIVQTSDGDSYYDCPTQAPPTATPVPPTPTRVPACGVACNTKADCAGVKDGCVECNAGVCSPPSTPTPTKTPPACGVACQKNADCAGAKDGCVVCGSNNTCQPPATPTPVQACNSPCVRDADCQTGNAVKDGCVACIQGVCKVPNTPTPTSTPVPTATPLPTATPTPTPVPFNPAACTCDGIEYSNIVSGGNATITSYSKVVGADTSKAKVVSEKFFLAEGAETTATIIGQSNPIAAKIVSQSPALVRYSSTWNAAIPQLKSGATYRIWSQIDCEPAAQAMVNQPASNVLGATTQNTNQGFFGSILNFFSNLFGGGTKKVAVSPTPIPALSINKIQEDVSPTSGSKSSLQLQTIQPVEVYQKTCSFIKFRYTGL
ncbi:MAG TPA: hypothetical protein VG917_00845 [Patescibacteria group bacterium]|nr:hypothetical protein [Patescibacteria group bacterium]